MNGMGSAGRQYVAGRDPPLRPDGLDRALRGRAEGRPPPDRPRSAAQGPGSRRRSGRGALRHPRRDDAGSTTTRPPARCCASTTTGSPGSAQQPSRALCRARLHPEPRAARRRRRDRAGRPARRGARARNRPQARHDAVVGPMVEPGVGRRRGERVAAAFPHDRRRPPRFFQAQRQDPLGGARRPASPASRCTWPTC